MSDAFNTPVSVDPRLLEVLVCPVTRGKLTYDRNANELISAGAKLAYPIHDVHVFGQIQRLPVAEIDVVSGLAPHGDRTGTAVETIGPSP